MGLWNSDEDRWIMWEIMWLWRIRDDNQLTRYGEILVNDLGAGNRLDRDDDSLYVLEGVSKPPLGPNLFVGTYRSILEILHIFLRLNASLRLDLEPD
jgi:hypothetical protein